MQESSSREEKARYLVVSALTERNLGHCGSLENNSLQEHWESNIYWGGVLSYYFLFCFYVY